MQVFPLTDEFVPLYSCCLEDWSNEATVEAGPRRRMWYEKMKGRSLRALLAKDDRGEIGGMVQYLPIEHSLAEGQGLYFINCIWVHGHKQGRGSFQGKGLGTALLQAAESDARDRGAMGMAAWGLWIPVWMKASWFKKHGYIKADRNGLAVLMWKPFTPDAAPPRWIKEAKKPVPLPGVVTVTAFTSGWCMAQNLAFERAKRACAEFGDNVEFREVDTSDKETLREWGQSDALFIDSQQVNTGPPPSYQRIRKLIVRRVKALG